MVLDIQSALVGTFVAVLCLLNASTATRESFITSVVDSIDISRGGGTGDLLSLMNLLATHYTPRCLTIVMLPKEVERKTTWSSKDSSLKSEKRNISANTSNSPFGLEPRIIINDQTLDEVQKTLKRVNSKIESIISCSSVSYIVSIPSVSTLLDLLTSTPSIIQLTRYYFFYAKNLMAAEKLLFDPVLAEEENVAVVIQQKFHNKTLWSVLTRQLLHPSGSPKVLKANTWSRDTGFTSPQHIFPDQMKNFYGKLLRGSVMSFPPFVMYEKVKGSLVIKPKQSLEMSIIKAIAQQLNFTYVLALPEDGQWGSPTADVSRAVIFHT
ncbi:hypothetical protein Pmani_015646 [Petrolisthes manimaculis]|uniref:Uncharacterized protein n=1 Tax=Petrolisthes manimaculis TaxID=1843537 RepID=A0AAE1U9N9_9EUCA|nr:hypothetical protein Pmani_015646 [Petrolisthes manimaculis]